MIRRTLLLAAFAISAASTSAWAHGPHDGVWDSVEARSSFSDGTLPKGFKLSLDMKFTENRLEYHSINTTNPAQPSKTDFVATLDSKPSPFENQTRFDNVRVRKINENEFEILKMKGDDVIVGEYWTFQPDGQTLVRRGVGKGPTGKSRAYSEFFQRRR